MIIIQSEITRKICMGQSSLGSILKLRIRWQLMFYDVLLFLVVVAFIFTTYGMAGATTQEFVVSLVAALVSLLLCRIVGRVYSMIIRYGGVHVYMRLFATDLVALLFYYLVKYGLHVDQMIR